MKPTQPDSPEVRSTRELSRFLEVMMRAAMWSCGIAVAIAVGLAGCASPGPGSYAAAAGYHEQAAQQDWAYGNPNAAQWEQYQANKDSWLSGLGF